MSDINTINVMLATKEEAEPIYTNPFGDYVAVRMSVAQPTTDIWVGGEDVEEFNGMRVNKDVGVETLILSPGTTLWGWGGANNPAQRTIALLIIHH